MGDYDEMKKIYDSAKEGQPGDDVSWWRKRDKDVPVEHTRLEDLDAETREAIEEMEEILEEDHDDLDSRTQ